MRIVLIGMMAAAPAQIPAHGQSSRPAPPDLTDHGTFEIFSAGKSIGTETFEVRVHSGRIEAKGEEQLQVNQNGKMAEVETISNFVMDSELNPITYTWAQRGSQSSQLSADFRSRPAHVRYKQVNGKEDEREFKLDHDVVVLDDNVIHHYELALARYDQSKGGPQVLSGFVPQEAEPGVLILNYVGIDKTTLDGESVMVRHYLLAAGAVQINLWTDDRGHLQLVSTADFQFQAQRKKDR